MRSLLDKSAFAVANTLAVLASLYIAFAFDLDRPYWAVFSVFTVAQPLSGAVRSKTIYRLFGTLAGAAMALFLVPPLVQSPVLLCLAMAAWVGLCLYVSLRDRTPRSYAFLLAGYTATIVGSSVVNTPEAIFDTAVSRVEEISLGIILASIAHTLFFPRNVLVGLSRRIEATLERSREWLAEAILRPAAQEDAAAQAQLAAVATSLHVLYTHVAFDTSDVPRAAPAMRGLLDRVALFLPAATNIQAATAALGREGGVDAATAALLQSGSDWLRSPTLQGEETLEAKLAAHRAATSAASPSWNACLDTAINVNLGKLVRAFSECQLLKSAILVPQSPLPEDLERELARSHPSPLHRDRGLALLSAFAAAGATLVASALWIATAWPEGAIAVQFAAIACVLFATEDRPAKIIGAGIVGVLAALPVAALYEFAILPACDGFVSLALVLSPILLLLSFLQTYEKIAGAALVLAIGFSGALALQSTYRADFAVFLNVNMAEIAGALIAMAILVVFRTIDPVWNALRIARAGWRDIGRLAGQARLKLEPWVMTMFDRIALVSSRLPPDRQRSLGLDGLKDLRVGLDVAAVRTLEAKAGRGAKDALVSVCKVVTLDYASRAASRPQPGAGQIAQAIDTALAAIGSDGDAFEGRAALSSLRLDLAPDAPPLAIAAGAA